MKSHTGKRTNICRPFQNLHTLSHFRVDERVPSVLTRIPLALCSRRPSVCVRVSHRHRGQ